ncbi:uncharacterized protein, partial [Dysidea avara]|uniref:uncharacterized protein n=1 Tax=Dysidea avara TaxID=196820 RepID=UPI00332B9C70
MQVLNQQTGLRNSNVNTGHSVTDSTDESLAVQTPPVNFVLLNRSVNAYPGQPIKLVVVSVDEQNFTITDNIQITSESTIGNSSVEFSPVASALMPSDPSIVVQYNLKTSGVITDNILQYSYSISVSAIRARHQQVEYFNLTVTPCPPGHALHSIDEEDEYQCRCNDDDDQNIVSCVGENQIVLKEGQWAHYVDDGSINGRLEYYQCPPGYCQCSRVDGSSSICNNIYYYEDNDQQCVCDREGVLCGKCDSDKAVSALLKRCVSCGKANIALIICLVIVDIIVITSILIFSVPLKSWLYPFLYYLQVTPHLAKYFPPTFHSAQPYLLYISSAASLYFPYDFCLYPGMSALVSYSLKYIPLLLTVIISVTLYTAHRQFKLGKAHHLSWNGLWVLIMLLSTDVLNTSISILNCPRLNDNSGNKSPRWFEDGTVECFVGGHLPLALLAITVLIFYVALIIFVVAVVMRKIKRGWAISMAGILHKPYKEMTLRVAHPSSIKSYYKCWAAVELIRRVVIIVFIAVAPGNLVPLLLVMMMMATVYMYIKPYQKFYITVLE